MDAICAERFAIPTLLLMEHAALALRDVAVAMLPARGRVLIVCGGGNNGGDGYALARHLRHAGHEVAVAAAVPLDSLEGDARVNAEIARRLGLPTLFASPDLITGFTCDLVVDALLGTGATEPPRPEVAALIGSINDSRALRLAVDVPSGLDCDAGTPLGSSNTCVRADKTVTFVAEKIGFPRAAAWTGEVIVADLAVPSEAVAMARGQG